MCNPWRVRVTGPLAPYGRGFREELAELGYSPWTVVGLLQLMAHLSRWLDSEGLDASDVTSVVVARFLRHRAAAGYVRRLSPRGLAPLLGYLRRVGVVADPVPPPALGRWTGWLRSSRGTS
jgi:integrase/recombinase XerD